MRLFALSLGLAATAVLAAPVSAQHPSAGGAAPEGGRPVAGLAVDSTAPAGVSVLRAWPDDEYGATCEFPAPPRATEDRPVFLTLEPADTLRKLPVELLALLAQDLAQPMLRTERRPDGELGLAPADGDFAPPALRTAATLDLRGDGTVSRLEFRPLPDSRLAVEVAASFESLVRRGGIGAFADWADTVRVPLKLTFGTTVDSSAGQAPVFRLRVPPSRPAMALAGNRAPRYPQYARQRNVEGTVLLQFVVDENGEPVPKTIKSIQPAEPIPEHLLLLFRGFEKEAIRVVPGYRFAPAESLGCRVKMYVQMPFIFRIER